MARSKMEQAISILTNCQSRFGKKRKRTNIAQRTRMNYGKCCLMLEKMAAEGLFKENNKKFSLTLKGGKIITAYNYVVNLLDKILRSFTEASATQIIQVIAVPETARRQNEE